MPTAFARHWTLDPHVTFLNHGSFGATPIPVLETQTMWRARMEHEPVAFFARDLEPAADNVRRVLGDFIGADPEELALVPNATAGINTVVRSLDLEPGDELLTTDHAYNAARTTLEAAAARTGARVRIASLPFPGTTPEMARQRLLGEVSQRTRLVLLDHVTSTTALVLPARDIVAELRERGIETLIDGAHAPGMLDVNVEAIGATYYAGNCHKWLCAPKGSGFLHVSRNRQSSVRPLAVSHGANSLRRDRSRFRLEHDWTGTGDPSAYLSIPAAIEFGAGLVEGGWPALMARNRDVALRGRQLLGAALAVEAPAPDSMIGSMASMPLPFEPAGAPLPDPSGHDALHAWLEDHEGIQVMFAPWPQRPGDGEPWRRVVRISAAPYVAVEDLEHLTRALRTALATLAD
ncbi:MAG: aminotransferase class V-fold PLP-dependent enzyme [Chloroflexi bacterium]|nr:aminotransferase class V-fold PLP-dependent enzyme [Chloroflexota bacterium]